MTVVTLSSLTRISDLDRAAYEVVRVPRAEWATGDYVVGEIIAAPGRAQTIELSSGRMTEAMPGDHVVGAFGDRAATLEAVGSWADIEGIRMDAMTSAGLFGAMTSLSALIRPPAELMYRGHAFRGGRKVTMAEFAVASPAGTFAVPVVLLVGTSMSAGKTTTGRLIVHELEKMGQTVVGTKLTGAGRYRDVLSFRDAGASAIYDFVDAGLPSTVVPETVFRQAIRPLLWKIGAHAPDVVVAEAGASPLEPYNGAAAIEELGDNIRCTVLCASDPYSVVGVEKAFGVKPDLVSGPAASTSAAIDLVRSLSGVQAINVMNPDCLPTLREVLARCLDL